MPRIVVIALWLLISAYAFYVVSRPKHGRERTGGRLVGVGAFLVAAVLAIPDASESYNTADVLSLIGIGLAGIFLGLGLVLAFPGRGFGQSAASEDEGAQDE